MTPMVAARSTRIALMDLGPSEPGQYSACGVTVLGIEAPTQATPPVASEGMKLLVIEDDPSIGNSIRDGLSLDGHVVTVVTDGQTGLHHALGERWDVVVLDIVLPSLNGFVVCSRLRAAGCQTPVLMLTAKDGEYDIAEALDAGADEYLVKPFSLVVLAARLRALVRRVGGDRRAAIEVGRLRLDPAARRCAVDGVEVRLTVREFSVLEYLVRQRNLTVSRTQLLDAVWDSAFDGDPNIVDVYVGHLRRKLSVPDAATDIIETVRGIGYRLNG
jgi:DNA-binding response OmpR family regulator